MSGDKKYLDLSNDIDDFKYAVDGMDRTKAGMKVFGKSLFNVGKYAVKEVLPEMAKRAEEQKKKENK